MEIKPIKSTLKFKRIVPEKGFERRLVSTSLPLCFTDVTPPRADPSHASSYAGGVLKRIGFQPDPMARKIRRKFQRFVRLWLRKNIVPLKDHDVPSFETWLENTPYTAGRKRQLADIWERFLRKPTKKNLRKVKSFIKDEAYEDFKYPRTINSRVDVAKCAFGPICWAASKAVFSNPNFIKNIPVSERAKAIREKIFKQGEECDSTDYTSYEAHFTADRMRLTTGQLFDHLFSGCSSPIRATSDLMMDVLTSPSWFTTKLLSFVMEAVRCSGEMDTSLSNGFANSMTIEFLSAQHNNKVHYYVEGDDGIMRWAVRSRRPPDSAYKELGLTIKINSSTELSELSFCGQVYDMDDLVVVTDIKEQLARMGWTNSRYTQSSEKTRLQLLRAKGFAMAYQYNGCPILSTLGRRIIELTETVNVKQSIINNWEPYKQELLTTAIATLPEPLEPKAGTRLLVEKLYNIPVWKQLALEEQFAKIELGNHEFPLEAPKQWSQYYENYHTTVPDRNPTWIQAKRKREYNQYIKQFANLKNFQL